MAFPTGASSCFFPASALPKSQRGSPAPGTSAAPPPTPVLVTAVPQGRVWPAQARHVAARPRRRSLAGDQGPWSAGGESRFPGGSSATTLPPRRAGAAQPIGSGSASRGPTSGSRPSGRGWQLEEEGLAGPPLEKLSGVRSRTPGTRPRAWPEGHWAVAFVQPLPKGRIAMGPTGLASDPGDAQPRPAPAPTVRGQQIFN